MVVAEPKQYCKAERKLGLFGADEFFRSRQFVSSFERAFAIDRPDVAYPRRKECTAVSGSPKKIQDPRTFQVNSRGTAWLASIRESPCNYAVANIGKQDRYNVCQIELGLLSYPREYNAVS